MELAGSRKYSRWRWCTEEDEVQFPTPPNIDELDTEEELEDADVDPCSIISSCSMYSMALRKISTLGSLCSGLEHVRCLSFSKASLTCMRTNTLQLHCRIIPHANKGREINYYGMRHSCHKLNFSHGDSFFLIYTKICQQVSPFVWLLFLHSA